MYKTCFAYVAAFFLAVVAIPAHAANKNAAPFGVEIGVATIDEVFEHFGSTHAMMWIGENTLTGGQMYLIENKILNVPGVQEATFIFDKEDVLAAVAVLMKKDPSGLFKTLASKYQVVSNQINTFMNYGTARLRKGSSIIDIDAPHLSFTMEVRYVSDDMMRLVNQAKQTERVGDQRRRANAL